MSDADPAPGRFVTAGGVRQHYLDVGTGDRALVVLHKVTAGAEMWAEKAAQLAAASPAGLGLRVVVPDLRGHGYTDKPDWGYSLVDYSRDVAALIEALGLGRPAVLGHSLGARVALALGAHVPEAVSRVIAVDPPVSGPGRARYPYSLDSFLSWRAAVEARGVTAALESTPSYTPEEARLRVRYGLAHSLHALQETWHGFHLEDVHALARDLQVPALLLYGERGVVGEGDAAELAAASPLLTGRRVAEAGHNVPWDAWPAVTAAVREFLRAEEPARAPA